MEDFLFLSLPDFLAQAIPLGLNFENLVEYTPLQHDLISHFLTIGVSAQAVGFVYFMATRNRSAPRYQPASVLSSVVMVSAFLILGWQLINWTQSFNFNAETGLWGVGEQTFSNGFRYLNWSIDVPCLLTQLLFVLNVTPGRFRNTRNRFIITGLLMIYTGYIGQFYQLTSPAAFWIWGIISTVFYIYLLFITANVILKNREGLPQRAHKTMGGVWWLILIVWTLYPLAYVVPAVAPTAWGAVVKQFLFTVADIFSKVIYGIIITNVAQIRSAEEGYEPAVKVQAQANGGAREREFAER